MLAHVATFAIDGIDARRVEVEADIRGGLPAFTVVGLADKAVREARERVRSAMVNSGFEFPQKRITVNLAPAYLRKIGPGFDLSLALALLVASGQLDAQRLAGCAIVGELGLEGDVRAVRGALAVAEAAARSGIARLVAPLMCAREAALVSAVEVLGVASLQAAVAILRGDTAAPAPAPLPLTEVDDGEQLPDLADVRGHSALMPALEIAAAGGHNVFMHGPPGTGKTMLARRLPSILPPLTREEAIEVTRVHSVAGLDSGGRLLERRPFRSPHHSISASGLVGGGALPQPGEATLAHHGVLFLDELSEFPRPALEALRQPLEDGRVTIVRAQRVVVFPTRCMLVAASNPCPCGLGAPACRCGTVDLARHRRRLSGPLIDRIDVLIAVERPSAVALREDAGPVSADVRARVVAARERQQRRLAGTGASCNAQMTARILTERAAPTSAALHRLYALHDRHSLSARGHARVLRVARTIADLDGADEIQPEHVTLAIGLRTDASPTAAAA